MQRIDIDDRNTALQVACNIVQVFGLAAVDVTWQVEIEIILLDFVEADDLRVARDLFLPVEDIDRLMNVARTQPILRPLFHEPIRGIDHKNTLTSLRPFLIDQHNARRDAGAIEQVGRQAKDAFDVSLANEIAANVGLGISTKQHPMRQNAGPGARDLQRPNNVQQVSVIALLARRNAKRLEPLVRVVERIESRGPPFVRKRWVGNDIVERFEYIAIKKLGCTECVALNDGRGWIVVQDHVHPCEATGRRIFFLSVKRDFRASFVAHFEQERPRTAGRIVNGRAAAGLGIVIAKNLSHDAAHLGRRVELAFALATFGSEMPHEVFVGIAQDVVAIGPVFREIERLSLEDSDKIRQSFDLFHAIAQFDRVVKVGKVRLRKLLVGRRPRGNHLLVDLVANVRLAFERNHRCKAGTLGDFDRRVGLTIELVTDVFDEQQRQDVVFVLASIHAAAQLIATRPKRRIKF